MVNLVECLVMATSAAAATGDDGNDTSMTGVYDEDVSMGMGGVDDGAAAAAAAGLPFEISSALPSAASPDTVSQCLSTWLIKTHTHFHGSDDLRLPWYFGALCWSYAVGGMMMFVVEPQWTKTKTSNFPYRCMAWMLILLQCESSSRVSFGPSPLWNCSSIAFCLHFAIIVSLEYSTH